MPIFSIYIFPVILLLSKVTYIPPPVEKITVTFICFCRRMFIVFALFPYTMPCAVQEFLFPSMLKDWRKGQQQVFSIMNTKIENGRGKLIFISCNFAFNLCILYERTFAATFRTLLMDICIFECGQKVGSQSQLTG